MKKYLIAIVLFALISPLFVFAQNNSGDDSKVYYVNVPVEKIYPTSSGYVVFYRTQSGIATVGLPYKWFNEAAGRADLVRLPPGTNMPSMSVFYRGGEFSHVRVYIHRNRNHFTWGSVAQGMDASRYFTDEDTLQLKF